MFMYARPKVTPRTGYTYRDPDTGTDFTAPLHVALVAQVVRHRRANKLSIPENLSEIIEDDICKRNPESFRKPRPALDPSLPPPSSPRQAGLSPSQMANSTLSYLRRRRGMVSMVTVSRRSDTCAACSENTREPCCYSCHIEGVFEASIGKHRHLKSKNLGVCRVDQTFTKPLVCVETVFEGEYPEHCWKKGIPNGNDLSDS